LRHGIRGVQNCYAQRIHAGQQINHSK